MRDPNLQLMIEHEEGFTFLEVNLRGCKAGRIILNAEINGKNVALPYELRERRPARRNREGISAADTIYLIMPDRFNTDARGNKKKGYLGGTINSITEQLEYLDELGVTALWLTPVTQSTSFHGYDTTDYYSINTHFGTLDDYISLIEQAHSRGIKVIKDIVFNHSGIKHPWISTPPEKDWYNNPDGAVISNYRLTPTIDPYAADIDKRQTVEGWFVKSMPDLNMRNKRLLKYLTQCTMWWIETADIDGIRMDTFPYSDAEAMQTWLNTIHKEYPWIRVIGETWVCNPAFTAKMQEGALDSSMDFALFEAFNYAKHEESNEWWSGLNRIYNTLCYDYLYQNPLMTMAFLDNHDTSRFMEKDSSEKRIQRLKVALAILLTIPRIPQIYYGTELLMGGTTEGGDDNVRRPMQSIAKNKNCNIFSHDGRSEEQEGMFRYVSRLLQWRKGNTTISKGKTKQFIPYNGIYVLARQEDANTVLLIANGNNKSSVFNPERYAEVICSTTKARDIICGREIDLSKPLRMKPDRVMILEFQN